jgi:glycine dehydrogenase
MAAMYAVYHGPEGLTRIARRVHAYTQILNTAAQKYGFKPQNKEFFDTLTFDASNIPGRAHAVHAAAAAKGVNLREIDDLHVGVTLDETVGPKDIVRLVNVFATAGPANHDPVTWSDLEPTETLSVPSTLRRESKFLHHSVFNTHHSETEMLRYIYHLQSKDLGLVHAMIPLGSCTMKLNSTTSLMPVTWPEFSAIHPFAPIDQVKGYRQIIEVATCAFMFDRSLTYMKQELENDLCKITGFHACSLQPNSGAAGEYAGLSVIQAYHEFRGEGHRNICLIPLSAHGTNPAVSRLF